MSGLPTTYCTVFLCSAKTDNSVPWSMVPKSMKPFGPAIASIRDLTSSGRLASDRSDCSTVGSNFPSCRSKSSLTSPYAFLVFT